MVYRQSILSVCDNSGLLQVQCIKVGNKSNRTQRGKVGELLLVAVKKTNPAKKVNKKKLYLALILSLHSWNRRSDGTFFRFDSNRVTIVSDRFRFVSTKVSGIVSKELRSSEAFQKFEEVQRLFLRADVLV